MFVKHPPTDVSPRSKRTIVGGVAFFGAALTFLSGIFVTSPDLNKGAEALAAFAANPGRVHFSWTMDLLYMLFVALALLAVAGVPRGRGSSPTYLGAALGLLGNIGHAFFLMFELVTFNMLAPAADQAQMAALIDRINQDSSALVVVLMLMAYALGSVLLVIGLFRARILPLIPLILIIAAAVLDVAQIEPVGYDVKVVLGTIVLGWIGVALLRLPKGRSEAALNAKASAPAQVAAPLA